MLLYLNNTGLMWELAPRHDALLVFAEHRYYGQSKPFPAGDLARHMGYLTTEQAMADFAGLIFELRQELQDPEVPVIGFGGSYGACIIINQGAKPTEHTYLFISMHGPLIKAHPGVLLKP